VRRPAPRAGGGTGPAGRRDPGDPVRPGRRPGRLDGLRPPQRHDPDPRRPGAADRRHLPPRPRRPGAGHGGRPRLTHTGMWIRILKPHERVLDWIERAQNGDDPEELGKDLLEMALDLVGCFDQTGISDAASALLAFSRGHWFDAGLSAIGIIPAIGDLAK